MISITNVLDALALCPSMTDSWINEVSDHSISGVNMTVSPKSVIRYCNESPTVVAPTFVAANAILLLLVSADTLTVSVVSSTSVT